MGPGGGVAGPISYSRGGGKCHQVGCFQITIERFQRGSPSHRTLLVRYPIIDARMTSAVKHLAIIRSWESTAHVQLVLRYLVDHITVLASSSFRLTAFRNRTKILNYAIMLSKALPIAALLTAFGLLTPTCSTRDAFAEPKEGTSHLTNIPPIGLGTWLSPRDKASTRLF